MTKDTSAPNDFVSRHKVTINIALILIVAAGLFAYALYTPGREGYNRIDSPELFFDTEDWIEHEEEQLGFKAAFPEEPAPRLYEEELFTGEIQSLELLVDTEAEELILQYTDYRDTLDTSAPRAVLLQALQGGLQQIEGISIDDIEEDEYEGHPALRFFATSRIEAVAIEGLFVLIDQELFMMVYLSDDPSDETAQQFFSSLRIDF